MPSMATTTDTESPEHINANHPFRSGLLAVLAAATVNALVRVIALAVTDFPAEFFPLPLGWVPVLVSSAVGAIGATLVYSVVARYAARPNRTFTIIAVIVLILSFGNLLTPALTGAPTAIFVVLGVMHVTATIAIVAVLTRTPISIGAYLHGGTEQP